LTGSSRILAASLAHLGRLDEAREEARRFLGNWGHGEFTLKAKRTTLLSKPRKRTGPPPWITSAGGAMQIKVIRARKV
jgi:alkanesulfonate monooxygenase SsuD/methylene tetrahydromethanopterin reductase-like flavin-dependent oxidoreductase (luciferase family)